MRARPPARVLAGALGSVVLIGAALFGGCWADFPDELVKPDAYVQVYPDMFIPDMFVFKDTYIPPADSAVDAAADAAADAAVDAAADATTDATTDTAADASGDATKDGAGDAQADAQGDGNSDALADQAAADAIVSCKNADKDSHTDCAGDCNDNDPLVFPGQTAWQIKASNGSFDYNCDKTEEPQYPGLVSCKMTGGSCAGDGWSGSIPTCGVQGSLVVCKLQGTSCVAGTPIFAVQGCR